MEEKPTITFETKCYEKDWKFIVGNNLIAEMISNCNYKFDRRVLFLNNFSDYNLIKHKADELIKNNIIDEYYVVSEHANEALEFFNLTKEDFKGGYYYSIAELVSIYLCKTTYNLHFSGDAKLEANCVEPWIDNAIQLMRTNKNVLVANPVWDHKYDDAKSESFKEDEDWYYSYGGFSDQCYLIKTSDFRNDVYKYTHVDSERYPKYGGELFEKRVDAYMRSERLMRITSKKCSYEHENFEKGIFDKIKRYVKDKM